MKRRIAVLFVLALFSVPLQSAEQTTERGQGWRQGPDGVWRGTGANFGQGWRRGSDGVWRGTGANFGQGWRRGSDGVWRGTGANFGQG